MAGGFVRKAIVYDLARTFLGPVFATPRGVDRVDFLLARHFSRKYQSNFCGILPTPWGMRVYQADRVQRGLGRLEELWSETIDPADDVGYRTLVRALASGQSNGPGQATTKLGVFMKGRRMASELAATGFSFGRSATASIPRSAVYLNAGQYTPAMPQFLRWLDKRSDVKPVFMLHDVIPLENPECVSPMGVRHHEKMVRSVARYAAGLIVTTSHARETVLRALAAAGRSGMPTLSLSLPLAEPFDSAALPEPLLSNVPYFVVCGTIEPRKNHLLLSRVWRTLPPSSPHLVMIGSVGWAGKPILDQIFSFPATREKVHHVAGLSTPAMKSLIAGSLGLLSPSLAEGFGLPIIEALHLGAPVVASNIPAHREVAGDRAILLDPNDDAAWRAAIVALGRGRSPRPAARPASEAGRERLECLNAVGEFLEAL
jgi:glycosyltransferase involved in cell wall biosynthesis